MNHTGCRRCRGLMVPDRWTDLARETERETGQILRCVSCGEIVDPVILMNRLRRPRRRLATRRFAAMISGA